MKTVSSLLSPEWYARYKRISKLNIRSSIYDVTNRCNPLFEAICAELPVVSVNDPSTADLLVHEDNALLADADDVEALGRSIFRICQDTELAASMSRAQRERAGQLWSWRERMAEEVRELEAIVDGRKLTTPTTV